MSNYIQDIYATGDAMPEDNLLEGIMAEYKRVIIESLITSFGLDMFFRDSYGGDVDTIHNVRQIGANPEITYKSRANEQDFNNRKPYQEETYHGDSRFREVKSEARKKWLTDYKDIDDVYTGGKVGFHGHTAVIPPERKAELDHIVECKSINDDRGRVLSGLKGEDLANQQDNWAWTNKGLNASMGAWARQVNERYRKEHGCDAPMSETDTRAYVKAHPDMDETTKKNLLEHYDKARKSYDARIVRAYYSSSKFMKDMAKAAGINGLKMGLRQVLGMVFAEILFSVMNEIEKSDKNIESIFKSIGDGFRRGYANAKDKYGELLKKFLSGTISGVLSSLVTTLSNLFFTTAKHTIRIIRQSFASLCDGVSVLLYNPDCLAFGERVRAGAKIFATGACIVAGQMVAEAVARTPFGKLGELGTVVQNFVGAMVTGLLSCTMLMYLDRNSTMAKIVEVLNQIPTPDDAVRHYIEMSYVLDRYWAKLQGIDITTLSKQLESLNQDVAMLDEANDGEELSNILGRIYKDRGYPLPWGNENFGTFMGNSENRLIFT